MRFAQCCLFLIGLLTIPSASQSMEPALFTEQLSKIVELQDEGRFTEADALARKFLNENEKLLLPEQRRNVEFEIERIRRTRQDYTLREERLIKLIAESLEDFKEEEFFTWKKKGYFDIRVIDGEERYMNASRANLFFRHPEIKARRKTQSTGRWHQFLYDQYESVLEQHTASAQGTVAMLPFRLTMTITVKPGIVPAGDTIRCWMPYPRQITSQGDIQLEHADPDPAWINNPTYPMRSLYFEAPSNGDAPTEFKATWRMRVSPRYYPVDPEIVKAPTAETMDSYEYFTREQPPHIVFTDEIVAKAREIAGDEKNPYLRARKFYDWMSTNLNYSYAREYSTHRNISDYVLRGGYGDCGQLTLFFMTLCRATGIPARWQSGWVIYPMDVNLHDWCEIFIEPYGWIPVDPNYGITIEQNYATLTEDQRAKLKDYYFGGLDAFRLVANGEHGYPHYPGKESFRSDTVDFQRGELEANGENLYFDQFSYDLEVEHLWQDNDSDPVDSADTARPQGTTTAR